MRQASSTWHHHFNSWKSFGGKTKSQCPLNCWRHLEFKFARVYKVRTAKLFRFGTMALLHHILIYWTIFNQTLNGYFMLAMNDKEFMIHINQFLTAGWRLSSSRNQFSSLGMKNVSVLYSSEKIRKYMSPFSVLKIRELSHWTRDLSQAEKKITVVTSWATDQMTTIFTQNDNLDHFELNRCHFVHLLSL